MATKRKTARSKAPRKAKNVLRETWNTTLEALTGAEAEAERQVKALLKKNRIRVDDATELLQRLQGRFDRERKKATKQLEARVKDVQARVKKERHALTRMANEAVQSALATFNIPSRREVAELTRRVEELSRKIDGLRRR